MRSEKIIERLRRPAASRHTVDVGLRTEATMRRGAVHFNSESVRSNSKVASRRAYDGEAEIFLVHCPDTGEIYAVPVAGAPKRGVTLRVDPTANSQAKGVRWASDYVLPA